MPGQLALMEDLIERMVEVMIDEEESDEEVKKWSAQTRENIQDAVKLLGHGKQVLTRYHQEQTDITQANLKEEEQKNWMKLEKSKEIIRRKCTRRR